MKRSYTALEATKTLPYVRPIVQETVEHYRRMQELTKRHRAAPKEERDSIRALVQEATAAFEACIQELRRLGVEVKDFEMGLVDFPAVLDHRPILLCWRLGEDRVEHWHEVDAGFAGRSRIPDGVLVWPPAPVNTAK